MATYTTVERIKQTVPALGATTVDSATIADFIVRAESIINAKVSKLYEVPVQDCPLLETLATDIAGYLLLTRRIFTQEKGNDSPWPDRYRESLRLLDDVVTGEIPLVTSSGDVIDSLSSRMMLTSNTLDYEPTFNEGEMGLDNIDPEKERDLRGRKS